MNIKNDIKHEYKKYTDIKNELSIKCDGHTKVFICLFIAFCQGHNFIFNKNQNKNKLPTFIVINIIACY